MQRFWIVSFRRPSSKPRAPSTVFQSSLSLHQNPLPLKKMKLSKLDNNKPRASGVTPTTLVSLCFISFFVGSTFCQRGLFPSFPPTSTNSTPMHQTEPTTKSIEIQPFGSKKQRSKTLLQIGANDGVAGNNDHVKNILNDSQGKAILVEGSPRIFELLTKNVKTMYDETQKRIVPINAMACEDGKQMIFYSPNIDMLREKSTRQNLDIPHWLQYQIGSLEKTSMTGGLFPWFRRMKRKGIFPSELSPDEFVLQESISCISLASIVAQSSLAADEIGVLAVDVEGFDAPIILESFKVPGLEPDVVVFEHKITTTFFPKEFDTVMETLEARGYKLNCHRDPEASGGWKCTYVNDVYAVKQVP